MQDQAGSLMEAVSVFKLDVGRKSVRTTVAKPAIARHVPAAVVPHGKERRKEPRLAATKEIKEGEWKEF